MPYLGIMWCCVGAAYRAASDIHERVSDSSEPSENIAFMFCPPTPMLFTQGLFYLTSVTLTRLIRQSWFGGADVLADPNPGIEDHLFKRFCALDASGVGDDVVDGDEGSGDEVADWSECLVLLVYPEEPVVFGVL